MSKPKLDISEPPLLEEFVSETLTAISKGVERAQNCPSIGSEVNPKLIRHGSISGEFSSIVGFSKRDEAIFMVEFEVSITATKDSSGDAKISISLFGQQGSVGGNLKSGAENLNKIRFKVPIQYRAHPNVIP